MQTQNVAIRLFVLDLLRWLQGILHQTFGIAHRKTFLYDAPTYAVLPGLVLTFTILSLDTIGRALAAVLADRHERDSIEPAAGDRT